MSTSPQAGRCGLRARDASGSVNRVLVVVVALAVLIAGALWYAAVPRHAAAPPSAGEVPSVPLPSRDAAELTLTQPDLAQPVLPGVDPEAPRDISAAALRRVLADTLVSRALGRHAVLVVSELGESAPLLQVGRPNLVTPASLLKLLTTTAALSLLGPEQRFATTVVAGTIPGAVTLVGGGDPLLTRMPSEVAGEAQPLPELASLAELARLTASRLRADGIRAISLSYDDSLFSGPAVSPAWEPTYVTESIVSPISALWVDEGRADSEESLRVGAPATFAAERFAALLDSRGIRVRAAPVFSRADPRALELARVESPPLEQIVEHIIAVSDNEAAEVLLRHVGLAAGFAGSFTGGVRGLLDTVTSLGIDVSGADVYDGSGLSRRTLVPVDVLVDVLNKSAERDSPQLRAMVAALPVAGFSGSLASRFLANAPVGLGVVRAKTGTLTGVHGLAGLVTTRGGSVLVFAAVADRVPVVKTLAARAQLERIAAALSTCAC